MDFLGWCDYFLCFLLAGHTLPAVRSNGREHPLYTIGSGHLRLERGVGAKRMGYWVLVRSLKEHLHTHIDWLIGALCSVYLNVKKPKAEGASVPHAVK